MQKTQLEHKSRFGPWSAQNDGAMTLSGYASVKGVVDAQGDVVEAGAYRGLGEFLAEGFVAVGHQTSGLPIGFVTEAREDERGRRRSVGRCRGGCRLMEKDEFLMSGDVSSPIGQGVPSLSSEPDRGDSFGSFADAPLMESNGDVFDAIARLLRQAVLQEATQIASIIAHSVQQGRRL